MVSKSLLLMDTLSIKKYIFATRILKEIRGASSLLDELNRIRMNDIIKKITDNDFSQIYANGGAALFIVPSGAVEEIKKQVSMEYNKIDAAIAISSLPYNKDAFSFKNDYPVLLYAVEQKRYTTQIVSKLSHPFFRDCESNKKEYGVCIEDRDTPKSGEELQLLSISSREKRIQNRKIKKVLQMAESQQEKPLWYKLNEKLMNHGYPDLQTLEFPETFEDIAENDPREYIAVLYADGNDMGQKIQKEIDSLEEMGIFSNSIDNAMYNAAAAAISDHLHPADLKNQDKLPFDVLLIGGDDLVMVVPGKCALDTAIAIGQRFKEMTAQSLCIGVAFAHAKYPIHSLLQITENLLKSAKMKRAGRLLDNENDQAKDGMINFMLIQQSGSLHWEEYKQNNLDYKETKDEKTISYERTCRPYTFKELRMLVDLVKRFKMNKFPVNKLQVLREAAFKNIYQSILTSLFVLTRSSDPQKELLYELFHLPGDFSGKKDMTDDPFLFYQINNDSSHPYYQTAVLDFIEIYNFVEINDEETIL